jgi:hypothetical protein
MAVVTFLDEALSSLKKKYMTVFGSDSFGTTTCSWSMMNDARTDFPEPGTPEIQRSFECWLFRHER